jgi:hypothetical protein
MKPEQQRITIAEACGWKSEFVAAPCGDEGDVWVKPDGFCGELPDYLNDLNACAEFENTLNLDEKLIYYQWVLKVVQEQERIPYPCFTVSASASQRAEAFLRALNKWDDHTK